MKFIFSLLLLFPLFTYAQDCVSIADSFNVKNYKIYPYFYNYERLEGTDIKIFDFYSCLANKASLGNKSAERYYLKYIKDIYYATKEINRSSDFFFGTINVTLEKINPSKELFETLLLFFADERTYSDELKKRLNKKKIRLGDTPDTHYGMLIYMNYIENMIAESQRVVYSNEFTNIVNEYLDTYSDKSDPYSYQRALHNIWYNRIKSDWEAGKIKLKTSK
jgi:hypothetical protein